MTEMETLRWRNECLEKDLEAARERELDLQRTVSCLDATIKKTVPTTLAFQQCEGGPS